jgi:hypothetical protein
LVIILSLTLPLNDTPGRRKRRRRRRRSRGRDETAINGTPVSGRTATEFWLTPRRLLRGTPRMGIHGTDQEWRSDDICAWNCFA